jgi:DNA-binding IclR family transcriptional regulator
MRELPLRVLAFVDAHLRSIDELQVLITCILAGDRWWDAGTIARELGLPPAAARRALERLAAHNLLDIRVTGEVRYQFHPGTAELAADARAVCEAYRANPVPLINRLTGAPRRSIRDFADAFRLRKDDEDDR